jgi:hypothetical protein
MRLRRCGPCNFVAYQFTIASTDNLTAVPSILESLLQFRHGFCCPAARISIANHSTKTRCSEVFRTSSSIVDTRHFARNVRPTFRFHSTLTASGKHAPSHVDQVQYA